MLDMASHIHSRASHQNRQQLLPSCTELSLLKLAQEMINVSRACWIVGYSRQRFYEIRRNY